MGGQNNWVIGQYTAWGDFYLFKDNIPSDGYAAPLSFKIVTVSGDEIVSCCINSFTTGDSMAMDGTSGFEVDGDETEEGDDGKNGVSMELIIGGIVWCKRKQRGNGYVANDEKTELAATDGNKEVATTEMVEDEPEIEVSVEMENKMSLTESTVKYE